jgi:polyisoprenoid-binding protein YceI
MTITETPAVRAGTYVLDRAHSTVAFAVRHLGLSKVRGQFGGVDATLVVDDDGAEPQVRASVDLATVDTGNELRDAHLQSTDFFAVEANPTMTFVSRHLDVEPNGRYAMTGDLTIEGRTRTLELAVEFLGVQTFPLDGSTHVGFSAAGVVSRKEFGVDFNVPLAAGGFVIGDRVEIEIDAQFVQESEADDYHAKYAASH